MTASRKRRTPSSARQAVDKLIQTRLKHPRITGVSQEIELQRQSLAPGHMIMVTGPTGAGKTTLMEILKDRWLDDYYGRKDANPHHRPVIAIEARATSEADFNWKLLYCTLLEQIEGSQSGLLPAVDYRINPATNRLERPGRLARNTTAALRRQVERGLAARGVQVLMIDEGGHFTNVSEVRMKRQTDALKSLANCAGCQIILFGSYDILALSRLSGQLARRIHEVHLSRYRLDQVDDRVEFERFLAFLEDQSGGYFQELLLENAETLQRNTLGCIGTLMELLRRFIARCDQAGEVSQRQLQLSLVPQAQHTTMLEEIHLAEQYFGVDLHPERKAA